jgi:ABC-2 type transport system ATP-binding protein
VGRAALAAQVVLTDLRDGGAGLEDLFLQLTAETQRETPGALAAPTPGGTIA